MQGGTERVPGTPGRFCHGVYQPGDDDRPPLHATALCLDAPALAAIMEGVASIPRQAHLKSLMLSLTTCMCKGSNASLNLRCRRPPAHTPHAKPHCRRSCYGGRSNGSWGSTRRLQRLMAAFWTTAVFSGATSRPRLPRLRMMASAAPAMLSKWRSASMFSTCTNLEDVKVALQAGRFTPKPHTCYTLLIRCNDLGLHAGRRLQIGIIQKHLILPTKRAKCRNVSL